MERPDRNQVPSPPQLVRVLLVLVLVTAALSLLYAVQYYLGGPIRLAVVSQFYDVAINPSGSLIAAGAQDGKVRVWDVPATLNTGIGGDFDVTKEAPWPVRILAGTKSPVLSVAFTPDGATLLSVSADGQVRRWATATGLASAGELALDIDTPLAQAAFSADRSQLAVMGKDGMVQVWSVADGKQVRTFGPTAGGPAVALSDDGTLVAASDGVNIRVWDVASGETLQEMVGYCEDEAYTTVEACEDAEETWLGHLDEVTALAFSPDNQLLASGSTDTTVVFWAVESGEAEWSSVGHW
ncbi:MAG: WD40 repeat domain-containing protein, partial [Anaerolineae bacterium]